MNNELAANLEALHLDAFGWALHCCAGDHPRAEDVLQNAYLKVVQGSALKDRPGALKTWWFGVIRFTAQEEFRRLRYRDSLVGKLMRQFLPGTSEETDPAPSPSHQLELSEQAQQVAALLAQLPDRQATVLHLVFYQDLSLAEAAVVLGISLGSVRQHYERGKTRLRSLLQQSPALLPHE